MFHLRLFFSNSLTVPCEHVTVAFKSQCTGFALIHVPPSVKDLSPLLRWFYFIVRVSFLDRIIAQLSS